ncbi:hypothetical protein B0H65DRAFT_549171 [Neurospora tetraspora]|uniref:Helicase ATP-binding domain-containing protein n=1 Tax=Neurospora tetraspora TaxID=94610 RepID=A0AAE0MSB2_9PEZI|nr:hypothetical protein B0H65DRAFT_549171 [Neurospora tetraspora]
MHGGLNGYNMLRSPLRGVLLASEVGTGKTLIYGTVLLMEYYRLKALEANKQPVKAYPSIIVMPSSLVAQTFAELHNTFHDLRFYVWYDTAGGVSTSDPRRERTLTQATFDALMDDCIRNRHSSETAQVVVIAAHTTVTSRWAKQSTDFSRLAFNERIASPQPEAPSPAKRKADRCAPGCVPRLDDLPGIAYVSDELFNVVPSISA